METWLNPIFSLHHNLKNQAPYLIFEACLIFILGIILSQSFCNLLERLLKNKIEKQSSMVIAKMTFYGLAIVVLIIALHHAGIQLKVLLGAASIFTVALGFASKTSTSNLISGLFLLGEKPFVVGDVIKIDNTKGEVLSIDLLSTKIRSFDNLLIRIPNESLINTVITNFTHFAIRRIDSFFTIPHQENLHKIKTALFAMVETNPHCLSNPEPVFFVEEFNEYGVKIQFSVWTKTENYSKIKNEIYEKIMELMRKKVITMAFPSRIIYTPKDLETVNQSASNIDHY